MKFRGWLARFRNGNRIRDDEEAIDENPSASSYYSSSSTWSLQHSNAKTTSSFSSASSSDRREFAVDDNHHDDDMDRFSRMQRDSAVDEEEEFLRRQIEEITLWEREQAGKGTEPYRGSGGYGDPYAPRQQYFPTYGYNYDSDSDDSDLYSRPPPRQPPAPPPLLRAPSPPPILPPPPPPPPSPPPPSPHPRITPARRNLPEQCVSCTEIIAPGSHVYHAGQKCNHAFCKSCLVEFVMANVEGDGTFPPRCCRGPIDKEVVRRVLDTEAWGRWEEREMQGPESVMGFYM
ncbi:hypothetical protein K440DRAFT_626172 [Wilcoxina mikolae CBS 423.85]|nr:hypothetical protein K440DRAFT_626172 [Wilcoxina mikolae CBS 423.85]